MIFVTVGAQMPFDRLIRTVDQWAGARGRDDVFAQVGATSYVPRNLRSVGALDPLEFSRKVEEASVIVAHAGMGSIITALELGKPIIVMPRRGDLKETRNDHQIATARRFMAHGGVAVAFDEEELLTKLDEIDRLAGGRRVSAHASPQLIGALRKFVDHGTMPHTAGGAYDGVICFGGLDWWYHNRGHYDMQMMRQFARRVPTLYVNSIGMRVPKVAEGRMFFRRVSRKLKSIRRGLQEVGPNLGVFSPITAPGLKSGMQRAWLARQVRAAARRMGIHSPLIWVACPPAADVIDRIPHVGVVYQRTDRYEAFPGVDPDAIRGYDRRLKGAADLTLFCASLLHQAESTECRRPLFIDHGVDYDLFRRAGKDPCDPPDVLGLPRPRVGFVGSIDVHTFGPRLFLDVAARLPDCTFILVGACSMSAGWCALPNVHLLGQRPYEQVAAYMASCDVLIMPWNDSEWIEACNPVKLKEYLAVGRAVVTTPFAEAQRYRRLISQAAGPEAFADAIRQALRHPPPAELLRASVAQETWSAKATMVAEALESVGVLCAAPAVSAPPLRPAPLRQSAKRSAAAAHTVREMVPANP